MDVRPKINHLAWEWLVVLLVGSPVVGWGDPPPAPADLLFDAELNDVCFIDPDRGWAVGDRGAIWRTDDGGRNWRTQESPLGCRWENVYFVDERNGWIVGGWVQPRTWQSRGAVLRTRDGGQNWMPVPVATLPALRRVRFVDERHGWAMGDASAMYPSGIFRTDDGGRGWTPLPQGSGVGWLTGDFRNALTGRVRDDQAGDRPRRGDPDRQAARTGIVAGHDGRLALISDRELLETAPPDSRGRVTRNLQFDDQRGGWLVGDGGLLMRTQDGGLGWRAPDTAPLAMAEQFDWSALALHGNRCWVAGAPGSCVLSSGDGGQSWEVFRTGQALPIRALTFIDDNHGWAVGALGTILATRDGGRTWRRQRGGGRVAVLSVFGDAERLPLELMAQLCGNDGYLGAAEFLFDRQGDAALLASTTREARLHAALVAVGASGAHGSREFPAPARGLAPPAERIVADWDQRLGRPSLDRIDAYLVRLVRQWRPEIVVTEAPARRDADPLDPLVYQAVMLAVQRAGQTDVYPDQIAQMGLEPWRAKKLFAMLGDDERGTVNVNSSQLSPRLGRPLADIAAAGRGLVRQHSVASPTTIGFRLAIDHVPQELGRRDFLSGSTLPAGGDGRRNLGPAAQTDVADLGRVAQKQRNIQQMLARSSGNAAQTAAWLSQLDDLSRGLGKSAAGDLYWQLAQRYQQQGRFDLAAETLQQLIKRDPQHDMADAALVWLVQYHSSGELAWRRQRAQLAAASDLTAVPSGALLVGPVRRVGAAAPDQQSGDAAETTPDAVPLELPVIAARAKANAAIQPAAAVIPLSDDQRPRGAVLAELLERSRPALGAEPSIRLPLAALHRRSDHARDAEPILRLIGGSRGLGQWAVTAQGELWLQQSSSGAARGKTPSQRPVATIGAESTRPRLDGRLSDDIWQSAARFNLRPASGDDSLASTAWIARDQEYLYLAVACERAPGRTYERSTTARPRDADLRDRDRVEFVLDVDRDYVTAYHLTVDQRGWTAEACWGDTTWNPTWFVAADLNEKEWTIEAAIPIEELVPRSPPAGDAWAIQVQRVIPGIGLHSWSRPAAVEPRMDGLGWLILE